MSMSGIMRARRDAWDAGESARLAAYEDILAHPCVRFAVYLPPQTNDILQDHTITIHWKGGGVTRHWFAPDAARFASTIDAHNVSRVEEIYDGPWGVWDRA